MNVSEWAASEPWQSYPHAFYDALLIRRAEKEASADPIAFADALAQNLSRFSSNEFEIAVINGLGRSAGLIPVPHDAPEPIYNREPRIERELFYEVLRRWRSPDLQVDVPIRRRARQIANHVRLPED